MKCKPVKIISLAVIYLCALALLGISGAVDPAFAAGGISINGGAPVTVYPQVTLTLTNPGSAVQMQFTNESGAWSAYEPFAATKQWTLSAGDGDKTVSVQFKNSDNSTITFSASISLDYIIDTSFNSPKGHLDYAEVLKAANSSANAVKVYKNKILTVGTLDNGNGNTVAKIIRYNLDGTYDTSFGGGTGRVYYGPATGAHSANAVAINPVNDKIVVVGTFDNGGGNTDVWVLQLNSDGTQDSSFATGGYLVTGGPGADKGNAVAIQPDGEIVVVGTYDNGGANNTSVWVLAFTPAGLIDGHFNNGAGNSKFPNGISNIGAHSGNGVALQAADGNIVVTGAYDHGDGTKSIWVLRLLNGFNDGLLDASFGPRGTGENTIAQSGPLTAGNAISINADGTFFVAGTYDSTGGHTSVFLLKLDNVGIPIATFGGVNGLITFNGGSGADSGSALAIQPDGRIVVVGTHDNIGSTSLMVNRVNADGSLDTTLNNGNSNYTYGTGGAFQGKSVALQPDGKIVVVGKSVNKDPTSFILTLRLQSQFVTNLLTVTTVGSGSVTVFPGSLTWVGSTGTGNFAADPAVIITLTAAQAPGASFVSWTGCTPDPLDGSKCTLTMGAPLTVTATFTQLYALNVSVFGVGTINSVLPDTTIACNSTSGPGCSGNFLAGTTVTLTATPPTWYTLSGIWGGGTCSGSIAIPCSVTMNQARTVTATYIPNLTVRVVGWGDYSTLATAYSVANASGPAATIQAKNSTQIVYQEAPLNFNLPVTVTLQGGKGSDFSAPAVGFTSVIGPLNISNGRLNATNLKIKQP
jgi:uncharacterized delta-60 repeat protein